MSVDSDCPGRLAVCCPWEASMRLEGCRLGAEPTGCKACLGCWELSHGCCESRECCSGVPPRFEIWQARECSSWTASSQG